jgi:gamma-glutamyltranspeptidase/glutathione hydrolase
LTKAYWKEVKAKGYKINETDKEIVGQVDAILVLPNENWKVEPIKRGQ